MSEHTQDESVEVHELEAEVAAPVMSTTVSTSGPVVRLVNLSMDRATSVSLKSGSLRLAPKQAETVPADELTDDARRVEAEGRITIRTL